MDSDLYGTDWIEIRWYNDDRKDDRNGVALNDLAPSGFSEGMNRYRQALRYQK